MHGSAIGTLSFSITASSITPGDMVDIAAAVDYKGRAPQPEMPQWRPRMIPSPRIAPSASEAGDAGLERIPDTIPYYSVLYGKTSKLG